MRVIVPELSFWTMTTPRRPVLAGPTGLPAWTSVMFQQVTLRQPLRKLPMIESPAICAWAASSYGLSSLLYSVKCTSLAG